MHTQLAPDLESWVLVAEDDPHLRRLIVRHLARDGHRVMQAADGREALEMLGQLALRGTRLAAIVMDVRMPGHTGLAILRGLRDVADETPIFMITAFGDEEVHRRAAELGARAVLDKPFAMEVLRRLVGAHVADGSNEVGEPPDVYAGDRMLLERYLDVVNRARAQHTFRRAGAWRPASIEGPMLVRVTGAGVPASLFVVEWRAQDGYVLVTATERAAVVRCELDRAHVEAAISSPWRYIAHPEQLALWF